MDIFCCGMYRSCSTWQYEVALEILDRNNTQQDPGDVQPLGYMTGPNYAQLDTARRTRRSFRVMKAHEGHDSFTRSMFRGRALGIYAHRDLRDVIYSLMHKRQQSFREIMRTGMIHQLLINDRFWRLHPQVLVQRYDDILNEPEQAIAEMADFLRVRLAPGDAGRIAHQYSRQANIQRISQLQSKISQSGRDLNSAENAELYDPQTLLHWNHIRPNAHGWRDLATPAERVVMQNLLCHWLAENNYPADSLDDLDSAPSKNTTWRVDAAHGLFKCHSREFSARHHRWAAPIKRFLGLGLAETRSQPAHTS